MTYFKSWVGLFILFFCVVFQVCDVFGEWKRIKHHPVEAENDSSAEAGLGGVAGVNKEKRFGDITVQVYYSIFDNRSGSMAQSTLDRVFT